ncbi:MAG: alpha-hydroxy-acid oxidizing protein [Chloroflexi bacterium]|nr:alpha-hydroxy-acid oxidizing protein [Chloroflexota bacterium]MBV9894168.1 alpha-hydroxy-acid oxidizing protein [Chloroflexota bacterium]
MTDALLEFRTLGMFEQRAHAVIPPDALAYAVGGSATEATLERNRRALQHLAIEQRVLMGVQSIDTSTSFLGISLPSPIIVCPMGGMYRFHPEGDVEMARGATRDGGMTTVAGGANGLDKIAAAASGPLIFQLYWLGDRAWVTNRLQQVADAGDRFKAFCLTVDAAAYSRRERDIVLNLSPRRATPLPDTQSLLTWDDVDWVRTQLPLPFGLKGIMTAADATIALDHGVDFIWVSNHGGRQLDDGRASIDALAEIADVVGGRIPIVVDSGFRRGTDAIKALALGATLVAFGRTALWGLAVGGADGVQKVLRLLLDDIVINMKLAGQRSTRALTPATIRRIDASGFALPRVQSAALDTDHSVLSALT